MTQDRAPERTESLLGGASVTSSWEMARARLANPEQSRTCWLATTRPDGRPHLMPVIAFWIDDAMHILAGKGTQKARNIAADDRCVIATGSTTLPSLDIVIEGRAEPITDAEHVRHVAGVFTEKGWPLEVTEDGVDGSERPDRRPAALHVLPDRPVEGLRSPRHDRHGAIRPRRAAETHAMGLPRQLKQVSLPSMARRAPSACPIATYPRIRDYGQPSARAGGRSSAWPRPCGGLCCSP